MKPIIFTLTGPTCAGKSTLEKLMVNKLGFANLISTTTRKPRAGEIDGIHYYFTTEGKFLGDLHKGKFVEAVSFNGNQYGSSIDEVNRISEMGKPIVVVVEPEGRHRVQSYCRANGIICRSIYVGASQEVIAKRFISRAVDDVLDMVDEDVLDGTNPDKVLAIKDVLSRRLHSMTTTERAWATEGERRIATPYEYAIPDFGEHSQEKALTYIGYMLDAVRLLAA